MAARPAGPSAGGSTTDCQIASLAATAPCDRETQRVGQGTAGTGLDAPGSTLGLPGSRQLRCMVTLAPPEQISLPRYISLLRSMKMFPIYNINIPSVEI